MDSYLKRKIMKSSNANHHLGNAFLSLEMTQHQYVRSVDGSSVLILSFIERSCQNVAHDKQSIHRSWLKPQERIFFAQRLKWYDKDSTYIFAHGRTATENSISIDKTSSWNVRDNHTSNYAGAPMLTMSPAVAIIQRHFPALRNKVFPLHCEFHYSDIRPKIFVWLQLRSLSKVTLNRSRRHLSEVLITVTSHWLAVGSHPRYQSLQSSIVVVIVRRQLP